MKKEKKNKKKEKRCIRKEQRRNLDFSFVLL